MFTPSPDARDAFVRVSLIALVSLVLPSPLAPYSLTFKKSRLIPVREEPSPTYFLAVTLVKSPFGEITLGNLKEGFWKELSEKDKKYLEKISRK